MDVEIIQRDIYYNFIILKNNMVVGSMTAEEKDTDAWFLLNGYIIPTYRKQGIYTYLWEYRHNFVLAKEPKIMLGFANDISKKLYIKHKFTLIDLIEDEFVFEKRFGS